MDAVEEWQEDGLEVYYTLNTGQDVHLICMQKDIDAVRAKLASIGIDQTIVNRPGPGARLVDQHLF